jgi:carboxyl-terminal processing protease
MRVPKYRWFLWAAFLAAFLFFTIQMRFLPGTSPRAGQRFGPPGPQGFSLLSAVMQYIRDDYLEVRDPVRTAEGAYRGMLNSLDALSCYLDGDLTSRYLARTPNEKETGLIIFKSYGSFPQVAGVVKGSPADKAGVRVGDVLTAIGHRNTLNMSLTEVTLQLEGPDETPIQAKFLRAGETLEIGLAKAVLFAKPYVLERASGRPAVLRIHTFSPSLAADIAKDVAPGLDRSQPLIVDLRDCAEGDLEEARAFVNIFLKSDAVGSFAKRNGTKSVQACEAPALLAGLPLALWVDQGTMGPAELAAGVLQEIDKAPVIGLQTPGLVARRELFPLDDQSSVLLTTEVFSLRSGRTLWGEGLKPDAAVPAKDQSDKAFLERTLPLLAKR